MHIVPQIRYPPGLWLGGRALVLTVIVSVLNLERMTFEVSFGGS